MDGLPVDDGSREAPNVNARQPGESFRRIPPGARREEVEHAKDCRGSGQLMRLRAAALGRVQVKATRSDVLQRDGPDHHHNDDLVTACVSIALEYRGRFAGGGSFHGATRSSP